MTSLVTFRERLTERLEDGHSRPFVCKGSPYACRAFVVGLNAATRLPKPFWEYWSDKLGIIWESFDRDYSAIRKRGGNRPRIERLSKGLGGALETNLYAKPSKKGKELKAVDRKDSLIPFLFSEVRPAVVFAHSNEPIQFFQDATGCPDITKTPQETQWQGHKFILFGRPGPLYTMRGEEAEKLGERLRKLAHF